MKRKTVYWFLVLILVVGMVVYPFAATERAEASTSVTNVWVELSDDTALNTTSTDLEYIIHFTTTTALTGGVDTITLTFPDGTVAMGAPAGQEGSGYAGRGGLLDLHAESGYPGRVYYHSDTAIALIEKEVTQNETDKLLSINNLRRTKLTKFSKGGN